MTSRKDTITHSKERNFGTKEEEEVHIVQGRSKQHFHEPS